MKVGKVTGFISSAHIYTTDLPQIRACWRRQYNRPRGYSKRLGATYESVVYRPAIVQPEADVP